MRMCKLCLYVLVSSALFLCACDLQPKIASIPDSVGMFIENRYPALLADPSTQPEIYNSAVTDYGVYASPELYGSSNIEDYVLYASVDDYVLIPQEEIINVDTNQEPVNLEEFDEESTESEIMSEYLIVPVYGGNTILDKIEEDTTKDMSKTDFKLNENTEPLTKNEVIVERGDTLYALARRSNTTVSELAKLNNLKEPYTLSIGQKVLLRSLKTETPKVEKIVPNIISEEKVNQIKEEKARTVVVKETIKPTSTKRVDLQEITVAKGDTLYSLSRKYKIPVNDLAVMNKLTAPFNLSVGQKLKVPKLDNVPTKSATVVKKSEIKKDKKQITPAKNMNKQKTAVKPKPEKQPDTKVSAKPKTESKNTSTKITARSSSKFSWPVRGKILSGYGPKNNGLINDGINISAPLNTIIKAAENGVIAYAGNEVKGMGNLIIIQHSDGWMTVYAHLNSMDVKRGAKVSVGQAIGKIGKTGKVDKPQLHFEIRKGTKSYNPTNYLKK